MSTPNEYTLVEKPILDSLQAEYDYTYIPSSELQALRGRPNEVLLKSHLIEALMRINEIDEVTARNIANDLAGITDNERWLSILRGGYSRQLPGEKQHRTIRPIDFEDIANNTFVCTNQLRIEGDGTCIPDIIIYVNGIPLVVIEAKSPTAGSQGTFEAIADILTYEKRIPRLFAPNLFNIATNGLSLRYGATGAPSEFWSQWRDPWPKEPDDFRTPMDQGLFALLEPSRLLDLLAHFIVFETRDSVTIKKICRYQQYRAVNKMVQRVISDEARAGLIWHTQGSGKSLTMVFAALKLKFHRGLKSERLKNPSLLVLTDRIDLHSQIVGTFQACGIPSPISADSITQLRETISSKARGQTVISTIFKFNWSDERLQSPVLAERRAALRELAVNDSEQWILMVDEAHRTQEKDLGAYVRAILPDATRFGFTGTPVKKGDKNTFQNFGAKGEAYLDKYGIDDAVNDGATVPIKYQSRKTEWHLADKEIDAVFDQNFAEESDELVDELKRRGVTKGDLARFKKRIDLIAVDIWAHFREYVQPDGFKAQVCAVDRVSCVHYKLALDKAIANTLQTIEGLPEDEAKEQARAMSVCVYSPSKNDLQEKPDVYQHQIPPEDVTPKIVPRFNDPKEPLSFLIVCSKLLTGFDAPIEQALYLDNPLKDHNLLQAIARTNRRYGEHKKHGLIVDYIGVTKKLDDALSAYRTEDVKSAMSDFDQLADELRIAHREVMAMLEGVEGINRRRTRPPATNDIKEQIDAVLDRLASEDEWFVFRAKAETFIKAYAELSPDHRVLPLKGDLKFIAAIIPFGKMRFEQSEEIDWKRYSKKVRGILDEHLKVTGLSTGCKIRDLSDPLFRQDFRSPANIKTAAVRKLTELKKITRERSDKNPARYEKFSDRVKEVINEFGKGLIDEAEVLAAAEKLADDIEAEDAAHEDSGLNERAYGVHALLAGFQAPLEPKSQPSPKPDPAGKVGEAKPKPYGSKTPSMTELEQVALAIDALYASDETAPLHWQDKSQLKKDLRGKVRRLVKDVDLEGWRKEIPLAVERYALLHYKKP